MADGGFCRRLRELSGGLGDESPAAAPPPAAARGRRRVASEASDSFGGSDYESLKFRAWARSATSGSLQRQANSLQRQANSK